MREFNEKRVYITMEISLSNKEKIEQIILKENISFNELINQIKEMSNRKLLSEIKKLLYSLKGELV